MENVMHAATEAGDKLPEQFIHTDGEGKARLFVRNGKWTYELQKTNEHEPPSKHFGRNHSIIDTEGLAAYMNTFMSDVEAITFINSQGIKAYHNAMNREESAERRFRRSLEYKALLGKDGVETFGQKALLTILETYPEVLNVEGQDPMLTEKVRIICVQKDITLESNLDPDNLSFIYKEKQGEQSGKMPRKIQLEMPIFEGSPHKYIIDIEVELETDNGNIEFTLINHRHERDIKLAVQDELETLKDVLGELAGDTTREWRIYQTEVS
ncbi:MAG: DUF2303 family protein [Deltaproteobacteria bacterium]|nr:DUF2303 family protein [Deltaproteobacteria bacterium]